MIESTHVLSFMKVVYCIYTTVVIFLLCFFSFKLLRPRRTSRTAEGYLTPLFYSFIASLIAVGVGIHVLTFHKIPWVVWEKDRDKIQVDREFDIEIADHRFRLPSDKLVILKDETVRFNVTSRDYTYGFGLFRQDGTMVLQMQVTPGRRNSLVWKFPREETFTVRSTEYSGPGGEKLMVANAVAVVTEFIASRTVPSDVWGN